MTNGIVFRNGSVFDGERFLPPGTAVLVRAGKIAGVSTQLTGTAEVVDLGGGTLLPGFIDSHVHPVYGGNQLRHCDLSDLETEAGYLHRVADYASSHPDQAWITGGGWGMPAFPAGIPSRHALDSVVPDRPVFLQNRDGHGAWVNTRALELAGVDRHTPDPADGRIERDEHGAPVGMLQEGATRLVARLSPAATEDDLYQGLLAAQDYLLSLGITGWQDAIVGRMPGEDDVIAAYRRAAGNGALIANVVGALWWNRDQGIEQLADLLHQRETVNNFRTTSVKMMLDGVAENHTAAMLEPYLDHDGCHTGNSGLDFIDPDELPRFVVALDSHSIPVHFHALGDRAVRHALNAIEAARNSATSTNARHHLAHLQVVHPDDLPRFAALDATANIQPLWASHEPQMDQLTIPFLGGRRAGWQYPFAALLNAGAKLCAGSDWPVSSPDPLLGTHVAVNRGTPDTHQPFLPEQAISREAALAAYTSGTAALPSFVASMALITVFAVELHWFPALGNGTGLLSNVQHLTMPAIALAVSSLAIVARVTRAAVREEAGREHVQTAISRGIPYRQIIRKHILRNAAIPITTITGITIASLIAVDAVVETAFSLNGLGAFLVKAAEDKDLAVVQGISLVLVAAFVLVNMVVDVLYAWLDPRVSLGEVAQ